jgi:hypothetical protein
MAYGFNDDRSRAPMYTMEEVDDLLAGTDFSEAIEKLRKQEKAALEIGGDGTLTFYARMLVSQPETLFFLNNNHRRVFHDKKSNTFVFDVVMVNTGDDIALNAPLFYIPELKSRYDRCMLSADVVVYVYDDDPTQISDRTITKMIYPALFLVKGSGGAEAGLDYFCIGSALPQNSIIKISGSAPSSQVQGWINSPFYDADLAQAVCDMALHGPGVAGSGIEDWEGELVYGKDESWDNNTWNNKRIDPTSGRTDCSGLVYMAYQLCGPYPQNSVQPSYVTDGILVSYAAAGEKLDLSAARPGDIICYQNTDRSVDRWESWTHCALYVGNNHVVEMAQRYPVEEHALHGGIDMDGTGPYLIQTPADEYRGYGLQHYDNGNAIPKRNRAVVRFL